MTMVQAAEDADDILPGPSPERQDKLEESMSNIEEVVRERNSAVLLLETGESGERPSKYITSPIGFRMKKVMDEHIVPPKMNKKKKEYELPYLDEDAYMFQKYWKEKLWMDKRDKEDDEKRKKGIHKDVYSIPAIS